VQLSQKHKGETMMNDFNFFEPYVYVKKNPFKPSYFVILLVIAFISVYGYNYKIMSDLESENNSILEDITKLEEVGYLKEANNLKSTIDDLNLRISSTELFNESLVNSYQINNELIENITKLIPEEMYFSTWHFESNLVFLSGMSYDRTTIAEFESKLRIAGFEDIHINTISESNETGEIEYTFDISMIIGGTNNEDE
jgi:hypothetical protein